MSEEENTLFNFIISLFRDELLINPLTSDEEIKIRENLREIINIKKNRGRNLPIKTEWLIK